MAMNINYIDFKVAVLLPNGTEYIKDYVSSVPFPTIGEKKRAIMSFTTDYNMAMLIFGLNLLYLIRAFSAYLHQLQNLQWITQ